MYACKAASRLDVSFEFRFLVIIQEIACRTQEDHGCILFETVFLEPGRIGSGVRVKTILPAQLNDGVHTGSNGGVMIASGLCKYQYSWFPRAVMATHETEQNG
jgi:hypothetical protein